jgi:regulator of protease activity HflC (stomatin/prohibitin superfamily)
MIIEVISAVVAGIILLLLLITLLKSVYLVRQTEVILVERFGKFDRMLGPGMHVIIPFIETPHQVEWSHLAQVEDGRYRKVMIYLNRIDLRESLYDFPKQNVITKDNVTIEINALLYYQIIDPKAAIYEIYNLPEAIEKLTQTTLRDVIGAMDLDETLASRDTVNQKLRLRLDHETDKWGVRVNRVELQEINPPKDIRDAMEKQMRAERERRAMILSAEGKKQSHILEAEGIKTSQVLRAEGEASAKLIVAEADAKSITFIKDVVPSGDPLPYLIATHYLQVLPKIMEGKDTKTIVIPYESSALMGSIETIKELFKK